MAASDLSSIIASWGRGAVAKLVRQRSAKPPSPVRLRSAPPKNLFAVALPASPSIHLKCSFELLAQKIRYNHGTRWTRRGSQVVRQRSAKPLFGGSIPPRASKAFFDIDHVALLADGRLK